MKKNENANLVIKKSPTLWSMKALQGYLSVKLSLFIFLSTSKA